MIVVNVTKVWRDVLILVIMSSSQLAAQVAPNFNVYTFESRFDTQAETYFRNNGFVVDKLDIMTQGTIVRDGDSNNYDPEKVKAWLDRYFPGTYAEGRVVLDWEVGPYLDMQRHPAFTSNFEEAETKFLSLMSYIKKLRPNLKLSIYAIPFSVWSNWQIDYYNTNGKLDRVISAMDFISNSMYIVYAEEEVGRERVYKYLRDNMDIALAYGKKFNKPVVPFLWHRIHDHTSDRYPGEIIQKDRFVSYAKYVQNYSHNSYKNSGFFWWDNKRNRLSRLGGVENHLDGTVYDAATYDSLIVDYARAIKTAVNDKRSSSNTPPK